MVELITALGAGLLATFVPLYLGLFAVKLWKKPSVHVLSFLAAISIGILFWFFLDVMNDAALLDVNQGFGGDYTHLVLASMFVLGLGLLFGLERAFTSRIRNTSPGTLQPHSFSFAVAGMIALGIGFHALGEGTDIGATLPSAASILYAIGGLSPGVAYVLHKFLEGFVVGTVALLARRTSAGELGLLGIISGVPTMLGFFVGLSSAVESTYFFALGGTVVVYANLRLIPAITEGGAKSSSSTVVGTLIGFFLMYLAGLFHG